MSTALLVHGMHGFGDCLHQRAILRQVMAQHSEVYVGASAFWIYQDLAACGLKVLETPTPLRTQKKNARREAHLFYRGAVPADARRLLVNYPPHEVRVQRSVLAAMCKVTGCDYAKADFSLPIAPAWDTAAAALLADLRPTKPVLIYRPLVERPRDWGGCAARNPDHLSYATLFEAIEKQFFVISVADLEPGYEYAVGRQVRADATFHRGEIELETLAALMARAALVFSSPGFAIPLAQAVGAATVCIFGGYERAYSFAAGARRSPYLGIEPMRACDCFRHDHACNKEIDLAHARNAILAFADAAAHRAIAA